MFPPKIELWDFLSEEEIAKLNQTPSERMDEICCEIELKSRSEISRAKIRIQALVQYLDEQWEENQPVYLEPTIPDKKTMRRRNRMDNISLIISLSFLVIFCVIFAIVLFRT